MSKVLNFVYEWIGPRGPLTNNRIPALQDFFWAVSNNVTEIEHFQYQYPHFYQRFKDIKLCSSSNIPSGKFLYEFNFSNIHYNDVLGVFSNAHGFLSQSMIHPQVKERILNRSGYIVITVLYESYFSDEFLLALTNYFKNHNIPLSQVIYVSNCYNGKQIYEDFCTRHNLFSEINIEYFPVFRIDRTCISQTLEKYKNVEYIPGIRNKLFLNFNRRYSDHRLIFYTSIVKSNLLEKFFISMAAIQPENSRTFVDNMKYTITKYPQLNLTLEDVDNANRFLPLILDNENFGRYPMESSIDEVDQYYNNSLINVVSETFFFNKPIHITEKTFKPIAFKQPFVIIGSFGSLKYIQDLGFKTFSQFWDEGYDQIQDNELRMLSIIKIIQEISNWSEEQKIKFSYDIKDIVEYNFNHLINMNNFEIDSFIEKYGEM